MVFRYVPREYIAAGSRFVAEQNIPIISDIAAKDTMAVDEAWQAVNGVDLEGNALNGGQRYQLAGDAGAHALEAAMDSLALGLTLKAGFDVAKGTAEYYRPSSPRGINNPTVGQAVNTGNAFHYDQLNGGTGVGGPTQLQQRYPNTLFRFTMRGQAGADAEYVGGTHPSQYPNSTWPSGFNYGDFKPNSPTGSKTFYTDLNSGKLPIDTVPLPYDLQAGSLKQDYFFGP